MALIKTFSNCEVIWVYGSSAAGKETFINYLPNNNDEQLLSLLNLAGKEIKVCSESIKYIPQSDNDPIKKQRENILESTASLVDDNTVILIKGQDDDLENNRLKRLKELIPSASHKIIFLHADFETLYDRFKLKSWWEDSYTIDTVKEWLTFQVNMILKLQDEFPITALSSNKIGDYTPIIFPPVLS